MQTDPTVAMLDQFLRVVTMAVIDASVRGFVYAVIGAVFVYVANKIVNQ